MLVSVSLHWILLKINLSVHVITFFVYSPSEGSEFSGVQHLNLYFSLSVFKNANVILSEFLAKKLRIYSRPPFSTDGIFFLKVWPCIEFFYFNAPPFRRELNCFLSLMQVLLKGVSMDTDISRKWKTAVLLSDPQEFLTVAMANLTDVAGIVLHNLI